MGIFGSCVVTTKAGSAHVPLDPTRCGDTMSHSSLPTRRVDFGGFIVKSAAVMIASVSSLTGCSGTLTLPNASLKANVANVANAHVSAGIPQDFDTSSVNSANAGRRSAAVHSSDSSASSSTSARMITVDTRSAVAAWRSSAARIDSEILANTARCSVEMALVDGRVCVDRWEASLVERLANGNERAWSPYQPVDGMESRVRAVSRPGVIPQGYISGEQGARACAASGKRLCSADEWESACRGSRQTQFPYGDERRSRVCNDDPRTRHPVVEVGMLLGIPESRLWYDGMNQPLINQLPESLLETGARGECTNDYGVFDMVGNLHEWISDPNGTFRGGYYMDTTRNGDGCSYATTAHGFTYHDYSTGFRCCADPDHVE